MADTTIKAIPNSVQNLSSLFTIKTYTYTVASTAANGSTTVTGTNFGVSTPSGYIPLGVRYFYCNNGFVAVTQVQPHNTGSSAVMVLHNIHQTSAATNYVVGISIVYVRNGFGT